MKTILCVLLGLVVLSSGCAGVKPPAPPTQNVSGNVTTSPNATSSNISQNETPIPPWLNRNVFVDETMAINVTAGQEFIIRYDFYNSIASAFQVDYQPAGIVNLTETQMSRQPLELNGTEWLLFNAVANGTTDITVSEKGHLMPVGFVSQKTFRIIVTPANLDASGNTTSANIVWPDTASLPFAPENLLSVNTLQLRASLFVRFSGNTALPDGTILFSQLYEDGKPCLWWPVNQPIKVENSFWTIITPLGVNGSPDALVPGPDYFFILYNDSIKAEHHFLVGSGPPAYVANAVSGNLGSEWQKTTISQVENSLGYKLPVPVYWPQKYEIKEVYSRLEPNSTPQITDLLLLISDNPIEWNGNKYTTRLALNIGWNEAGLGLKMPWAEFMPEVSGRLEQRDGEYILWWPSYGTPQSLGSTLRLYADFYFPKDEMVKIAASTPTIPAIAFTTITAPLTLDGSPPWYYSFYLGTIWSIILFSIIIAGFIVFFVMRFRQRKNKATILFERLGLGVALFCLLGYLLYLLLLMI